jgi:hypothetical protein
MRFPEAIAAISVFLSDGDPANLAQARFEMTAQVDYRRLRWWKAAACLPCGTAGTAMMGETSISTALRSLNISLILELSITTMGFPPIRRLEFPP